MPIGWGIIGIGTHAERFMRPAISKVANAKLVAVCDIAMERANNFAARHNIKGVYDSLEKMLKDPKLDVLCVATPNNLHAEQTIQAAEAGKHVLCEKPMAINLHDAELMIEACNRNNVKLGVDYQNRYHPAHVEARRLVQSGATGEISVAKAQYCRGAFRGFTKGWRTDPDIAGAGALMGQGLHPTDLLRFLIGSEVEEVRALTDEDPPSRPVDDMNYVILKFKNGAHGVVVAGVLAPRTDNDAILYGEKAKITCKGTVGTRPQGELLVEGDSFNMQMSYPFEDDSGPELYRGVVEDFTRCIEENSESIISGYNGMQMVKITNAILESSREGKAVRIK